MTDKTIREGGNGSSGSRAVREGPSVGGTIRESGAGATLREGIGAAGQDKGSGSAWLPGSLANRFEVVEELPTRGSEADLYVVSNADGRRFVAKIYRRGIQPKEEILGILKRAEFEHVVQLEEFGEEDGRWWELIEYIEHSSLRALIDQEGPKLPDATARQVLQELNDALTHLHALPIEHRDLKPDNVLVRTREPLDLVLADFGIASVMDASVRFTDTARTIRYAPPEAVGTIVPEDEGNLRNMVAIARTRWDYWSLGMILVEMLTGEHPYSGISEAAIGHRLATQNVDDLVEGIEQEGWRKLCRGLLRRDPGKRWGSEQVSLWLKNERDPKLVVEEETAPTEAQARPIRYFGKSISDPRALLEAMRNDWDRARDFLHNRNRSGTRQLDNEDNLRRLHDWLKFEFGYVDVADRILKSDQGNSARYLTQNARTFLVVHLLAALCGDQTQKYKDLELTDNAVRGLAERAAKGDRNARTLLLELFENKVLDLAGGANASSGLTQISKNWRDAVSDYRSKLQDVERNGARAPALEGDTLVKLLAAALPVSSVVSELRTAAQRASTSDARECSWFRNLGDPDKASVGAIMIMPHVIREAEAGAKQRRYDTALENFGVPARFMLGSAGGLVGGIVTAFVPGFVVYWPIVWIWGEKSATTIALLWMIGCAIVAGLSKWVALPRLVGNESQDHSEVRTKGLFYLIAGAAVIAGVLFYGIPEVRSEYQKIARKEERRIAGLSANVWATGPGAQSSYRNESNDRVRVHVRWRGDFERSDDATFTIVTPNQRRLECGGSNCGVGIMVHGFQRPGEYRLQATAAGRTLATYQFTILQPLIDGIPAEYIGRANGNQVTISSREWSVFYIPRGHCLHWQGSGTNRLEHRWLDNDTYMLRSTGSSVSVEIATVQSGQSRYGRYCS